jgi:hypothetical protein
MCNFESYQLNQSNLEPRVLSSRMSVFLFFRVSFTQDGKYFLQHVLCTKTICYLERNLSLGNKLYNLNFNQSITLNLFLPMVSMITSTDQNATWIFRILQ